MLVSQALVQITGKHILIIVNRDFWWRSSNGTIHSEIWRVQRNNQEICLTNLPIFSYELFTVPRKASRMYHEPFGRFLLIALLGCLNLRTNLRTMGTKGCRGNFGLHITCVSSFLLVQRLRTDVVKRSDTPDFSDHGSSISRRQSH